MTEAITHTPEITTAALVPYPPAPWRAHGTAWAGLFSSPTPAALPAEIRPLLGSRARVVGLARYAPGSMLTYDECFIGVLARVGMVAGLYIERMWVDSAASLAGGRRIWGMPKELAEFRWQGERCELRDVSGGTIAAFAVNRRSLSRLSLPGLVAAIGRRETAWAVLTAPIWARLSLGGLAIEQWNAERLGFALGSRPFLALAAPAFSVRFLPPVLLHAQQLGNPPPSTLA